jgi:hypothetical protein
MCVCVLCQYLLTYSFNLIHFKGQNDLSGMSLLRSSTELDDTWCAGWEVNTFGLYLGGAVFKSWPGYWLSWLIFCGFRQFLQINAGIIPWIKSGPLPCTLSNLLFTSHFICSGAVGWGTVLHAGKLRVWFLMVSLEFFVDIILPVALWPWGWLSL